MRKEKAARFFGILKERFTDAEVGQTSVLIAYFLLLSLFPMLIAVGNLLPYFNLDPNTVVEYTEVILPEAVQSALHPIIYNLLTSSSSGLLSISALAAIWSSSRGVTHLQRGMNKAYGLGKPKNFVIRRLVSLVTIFAVLLLLAGFAVLFSVGDLVLTALGPVVPWAGQLLRQLLDLKWPVTVLVMFAMLLLLYRVTPDVKLKLRDVWPGTLFATVGLLVLVEAMTVYLRFSTRTFSSYGALAAFVVLMFWLNWSAMAVILGAVLNSAIGEYRHGKAEDELGRVENAVDAALQKLWEGLARRLFAKKKGPPAEDEATAEGPKDDRENSAGENGGPGGGGTA